MVVCGDALFGRLMGCLIVSSVGVVWDVRIVCVDVLLLGGVSRLGGEGKGVGVLVWGERVAGLMGLV